VGGSTRYVALLRGVNLAGRNKVAMPALRDACEAIGCSDVSTYIQSGNVVLTSPLPAARLGAALEEAIAERLGVETTVVLRTHAQLAAVLAGNPFPDADAKELHVGFLTARPGKAAVAALADLSLPPDELAVGRAELYFRLPNGMGRSKLAAFPFERRLGLGLTMRNWRTVTRLHELSA
jgi:uncharacterized protein (DUF1697 family)